MPNIQNPSPPADGYRGRFAPSPTGPLHAGSLVAALGSWLDARKNHGKWLLRMEDLDAPRCIPGADQEILRQLLACGLTWDEEPSWQSKHQERYKQALEHLNELQIIYPCTCSRQGIASALEARGVITPRNQEMIYPGTCRPHQIGTYDELETPSTEVAWRLALPPGLSMHFEDLALGKQTQDLNQEVGDFVLRRRDGIFTYQLAVVVDDAEQGITHIVRGADLLDNTARQIYLQRVLEYETPSYLHLPLVLDGYGEKLSKQTLASAIHTENAQQALQELRKAARHLGLRDLPYGKDASIAEWLLAATQAWDRKIISS
ncbi:tRNA glutamyl-Q(34) synthetase GluQRS [Polynucleobacter sp. AP-Sving-400A-A2]|uniref:tRNA glutamyl-Q(34) synthetase GluQRS n=1 Tax=Polynucleobacter sp. AP-Sving-400A-A2 TaxID=2081049 RepID=UPI00203C229C|nr:tRNA glutamyl-Q(34) synthetase GluQRS [Polynucleobacter sp. AP-Sving-400A-A2]QWE15054.1 tRNA glutamyl-Q(34) synthetase GluQRS [Polynucleobacter sp. AP-Sving-400A-A2]